MVVPQTLGNPAEILGNSFGPVALEYNASVVEVRILVKPPSEFTDDNTRPSPRPEFGPSLLDLWSSKHCFTQSASEVVGGSARLMVSAKPGPVSSTESSRK